MNAGQEENDISPKLMQQWFLKEDAALDVVKDCESDVTYDQEWWPVLGICALHLSHPKCHTQQWTHTHIVKHTTGAVGSHLCCGARGAVGGSVPWSRAPQSWYWGWRERFTFTPPFFMTISIYAKEIMKLAVMHDLYSWTMKQTMVYNL